MKKKLRNAVDNYLSIPAFKQKWEKDQKRGAGFFYALTYYPIFSFFREHEPLSDALELKVALVFSWNPRICEVPRNRFEQAKNELAALQGSVQKELTDKGILDIDPEKVVRGLWDPVKKATSKSDSGSGVSVTKFLHFSFTHVFPMIDIKTMQILGGTTVDLDQYSKFLSAWKEPYSDLKASFDKICNVMNMPVARVVDVMIFTPKRTSKEI